MHVFRNTAGVWNLTNDYYRPTDQREVMSIIDPLTVVNSTSCYSVDSWDSCSFIETPGVFEISKDPAIFFEHESHESYEWPLRGNTAGVWNLTNDRWTTDIIVDCYSVDSCDYLPFGRWGFTESRVRLQKHQRCLKSHEIWRKPIEQRILALIVIR